MSLGLVPVALIVGALIGAVGVGGVALPPLLTWVLDMDPTTAAGTSMWSFLFTGLIGTAIYARHRIMPWRMTAFLSVGVCPAGLLGAIANSTLPDGIGLLPLGVFTLAAGIYHLGFRTKIRNVREQLPATTLIVAGAVVGFCSALTGTGGPVFLIPVLLALGVRAVTAVAAGQAIQLPLVVFAVAGYAAHGAISFALGMMIGIIAGLGVIGGALIAMRQHPATLRSITAIALVGFGAMILGTELVTLL